MVITIFFVLSAKIKYSSVNKVSKQAGLTLLVNYDTLVNHSVMCTVSFIKFNSDSMLLISVDSVLGGSRGHPTQFR